MNKKIPVLFTLLFLILVAGWSNTPGVAGTWRDELPPVEIVPINGIAYWATEPTGPDFQGVTLIPFQAQNPTRDAWEQTQQQNIPLLASDFYIENIQVSHSGWFTYASHFINDFSEVMVYLDPTDPDHLLGASKFFYFPQTYDFYTGVFESYDGGLTWTQLQPNGIETYSLTSDPVTTFDHLGNGYFTLLTRGPTGLDMLKKPVGGSWGLPVVVDRTTYTDKQWIMGDQDPQGISPYAGYLYMSWTDVGSSIDFARSTDSNANWSPPLPLASGSVQGSIPGVAPDGTVYVVYGRNIFYGPSPGTMEFVKSTDGGASFSAPAVAANITAIPWNFPDPLVHPIDFRTPASLPAFAVSPVNGNLYIAWADYRNGDSDIYFTRSTNGGTGWSSPVRLNDDPLSNGIDQFQPQVSVAPNGRVAVMWFDRRLPCPDLPWVPPGHVGVINGCIDTFMARSYDDGVTWTPNARASSQTWDWTINLPITSGGDGFIGDYQGIASSNDYDYPFWNATANLGENAENYQEIFVARVPVPFVNLSVSDKAVYPEDVGAGDVLTYTIALDNAGIDDALGVTLSDTIPFSTTYVPGSLTYPSGIGGYDPLGEVITWTGVVSIGVPLEIIFQVSVDPALPQDALVVNTAHIADGTGMDYQRVATATVHTPPTILATRPVHMENNVPITTTLAVTFSEPMDASSLDFAVNPDPGAWVLTWDPGSTTVYFSHAVFDYQQTYTVTITAAEDQSGTPLASGPVPNPWSFTTADQAPYILLTRPVDGDIDVPIDASLVITFSEPVVTGTFAYTVTPDPGGWNMTWLTDSNGVVLDHAGFAYSQTYTATIYAEDLGGLSLIPGPVPNPWSFTTVDSPVYVMQTNPADGESDVPITASLVIQFSEPVLTGTLVYTITDDPGGWLLAWDGAGTTVTMTTAVPWDYAQTYTVTISVQGVDGRLLAPGLAPNPWSFTTVLRTALRFFLPIIGR